MRLLGREVFRQALWQSRLTDAVNANLRIWRGSANGLIFGPKRIFALWLGLRMVLSGAGFSIGMMLAYLAYKGQFLGRAASLIDQGIAFRLLDLHLERLSVIALSPEDRGFAAGAGIERRLVGSIAFKEVFYRYAPSEPLVLTGVTFSIAAGEHVAGRGRPEGASPRSRRPVPPSACKDGDAWPTA